MTETFQQQGGATGTASDVASAAREKAGEGAQQVMEKSRGALSTQVDQRSTQAGEQIRSLSDAMRQSADSLREQDQHGPARMADQVADRSERLASYLSDSDGDRLLHDVEHFARRQPVLTAGIGMLLGLAAARALKASSSSRYEQQRSGYGTYGRSDIYSGSGYGGYATNDPTLTGRPDYTGTGRTGAIEPRTTGLDSQAGEL